ncbi:hypothetical protein MKW92_045474, partial [Papaver armeniacum]
LSMECNISLLRNSEFQSVFMYRLFIRTDPSFSLKIGPIFQMWSPDSNRLNNFLRFISLVPSLRTLTDFENMLGVIVKVFQILLIQDYLRICQCLMSLDESAGVAMILEKLLQYEPVQSESSLADNDQVATSEDIQMSDGANAHRGIVVEVMKRYNERVAKLKGILCGETVIKLTLQFLYSNNRSDLLILKTIKQSVEMRKSVCHKVQQYIRATNWAKFSATIWTWCYSQGSPATRRSPMAPYLPQKGGALYALGLIHANHGEGIKQFLCDSLRSTNVEIYDDIKNVLYTDSVGMGLLMVGTASEKSSEMLAYAHETQHEKIIRYGLALGIALTSLWERGRRRPRLSEMTRDQDPILLLWWYVCVSNGLWGTTNNKAIRRLLHFAISMLLTQNLSRCCISGLHELYPLLSESYNPHVRYGAAMAVGISYAGTDLNVVDFVRQWALIAMAMVMIQTSKTCDSRVGSFRRQLEKIILDKHEDTMSKMGAILASGILDARGRNVTIKLLSKNRHDKVTAVVGLFCLRRFLHDIYEYILMDCDILGLLVDLQWYMNVREYIFRLNLLQETYSRYLLSVSQSPAWLYSSLESNMFKQKLTVGLASKFWK